MTLYDMTLYHRKGTFTAEQFQGPDSTPDDAVPLPKLPRGVKWYRSCHDPKILVPVVRVKRDGIGFTYDQIWTGWWILRDIKTGRYAIDTPKGFAKTFEPMEKATTV